MHVIKAMNVRDAFYYALDLVIRQGTLESTRLGDGYVLHQPVTIRYQKPKQHVLLDKRRDANPFFHLMEAMWMLAGRDDAAFLDNYVHDFSERFSVDGIVPDAYGYRWRNALGFDQLAEIIRQLRDKPNTRQAVLQMWGAGTNDLHMDKLFKPCNLVACFAIHDDKLDMTVYNRSNDLVWGCCGANAVHFPILQEYIATKIGVEMGRYWQVSNNLHLYADHYYKFKPDISVIFDGHLLPYQDTQPLMETPEHFDEDLETTMDYLDFVHQGKLEDVYLGNISNPFLTDVVVPMAVAYRHFRDKDMDAALKEIGNVKAEDWGRAGREWLARRIK